LVVYKKWRESFSGVVNLLGAGLVEVGVTLSTLDVMERDIRRLRDKMSIEPGRITVTGRIILRGNL
jgi:hypothetical protein